MVGNSFWKCIGPVCFSVERQETRERAVYELRHHDDSPVEKEYQRGAGLQCLRTILQAPWSQPTAHHEERLHTGNGLADLGPL